MCIVYILCSFCIGLVIFIWKYITQAYAHGPCFSLMLYINRLIIRTVAYYNQYYSRNRFEILFMVPFIMRMMNVFSITSITIILVKHTSSLFTGEVNWFHRANDRFSMEYLQRPCFTLRHIVVDKPPLSAARRFTSSFCSSA